MVFDADQAARNAEADRYNKPGYCLQQVREWAGIDGGTRTAALAWANAERKHYDRNVPRGAFAFWTGGSLGYGHIAMGLGNGRIRSTDADSYGVIATRSLQWFDDNWGSTLKYVGWTDNLNGVTVPGVIDTRDWFDMADKVDLREVVDAALVQLETKTDRVIDQNSRIITKLNKAQERDVALADELTSVLDQVEEGSPIRKKLNLVIGKLRDHTEV